MKKLIAVILIVCPLAYGYHYYYVDTLSFAELIGETGSPTADLFINLFDFDTGVTRQEVHTLAANCKRWNARMDDIRQIQNPAERDRQQTLLVVEIMQDKTFKKLAQKLLGTGAKSTKSVLELLTSVKSLASL